MTEYLNEEFINKRLINVDENGQPIIARINENGQVEIVKKPDHEVYPPIKVFCSICMEYIFNTTDKFMCGGPYNGAMFAEAHEPGWGRYFLFHESITDGNLFCPRCEQSFVGADGSLVTEFGRIKAGQKTVDVFALSYVIDLPHCDNVLTRSDVMAPEGKPKDAAIATPKGKPQVYCKKCGGPMRYYAQHRWEGCPAKEGGQINGEISNEDDRGRTTVQQVEPA